MKFRVIGAYVAAALLVPSIALAQAQPRPAQTRSAPAPQAQQQGLKVPPVQALLILIRSTMIAFDQANRTGVYHVFYGLGSDSFRSTNSPEKLAQAFAQFRAKNIDLSPVAIMAPKLRAQPAIEQNRLHLVGFFPTSPAQIDFDLWFEPSQNRWKMAQLQVGLSAAPAQAQQPKQGQPAQPPRQGQPQPKPSGR